MNPVKGNVVYIRSFVGGRMPFLNIGIWSLRLGYIFERELKIKHHDETQAN